MKTLRYATFFLLTLAMLGCGDDDRGSGDGGTVGMDGSSGDAGDDAGLAGVDRTPDPACAGTWVVGFTGIVTDERGAPIPEAFTQICIRVSPADTLVCLDPPQTSADGTFEVVAWGEDVRCMSSAAMRVFKAGPEFGSSYCHIPLTATDSVVELTAPLVMYDSLPPVDQPPLGNEASVHTVVFDSGLEIDVIPERLGLGLDYDELGARRVPLTDPVPCFLDQAPDLTGVWTFGDEGPVTGGGFTVIFPNDTGLGPGAPVELLLLGGLNASHLDGRLIDEAEFVPFDTATVSADGATIQSDIRGGLPYFSWLGYRPMP